MATFTVNERSSAVYSATIEDENGDAIAAADLSTLTLTLYDVGTLTVINDRNAQDVLNANNVTVSAAGVLSWSVQPADNIIVSDTVVGGATEQHCALFRWTWAATKAGVHPVTIKVTQLAKVT